MATKQVASNKLKVLIPRDQLQKEARKMSYGNIMLIGSKLLTDRQTFEIYRGVPHP